MKIKELREQANLSQTELAQKLGIVRSTVCQYEKGNREPDLETLVRIADIFNVSVDYLLGRDTQTENYQNGNLAVNEQFVTEYNHLFNDIYFNRYTKIYSLLNQEQRIYLVGVVYGAVEQFGISFRDIG